MRTKPFARLGFTFALVAVLASIAGRATAQNVPARATPVKTVAPRNPFAIQPGINERVMPVQGGQPVARQLNPQMKTPFDRVLAPTLAQILKQAKATAATGAASRVHPLRSDATAPPGSASPNFPAFVAAPFLALNSNATGDSTSVFATVTGDFNNDGKPDIAAVQVGGTVTVILNPGSFTDLSKLTPLPPNTSLDAQIPNVASVVAVDMNGDGNLDLVGQDIGGSQIVIWLGKGDGTFGDAITYPVSPASGAAWFYGGAMLVGDFNGDGHPDVVALTTGLNFDSPVSSPITLQTFLSAGDGSGKLIVPTTENDTLFHDFYYSNPQQAAVISNDGTSVSGIAFLLQDDAINDPSKLGANVLYVSSNGDGTFSSPIEPTSPVIVNPQDTTDSSFFATNLSVRVAATQKSAATARGSAAATASAGEPVTDIVFMTGDGAVYDAPYKPGSGSFVFPAPSILVGSNGYGAISQGFSGNQAPIKNQFGLNLADMNNDGSLDLVVYTGGSTLIFPSTGSGTYGAPAQVVGGLGGDQQPQPANFDGSGFNSFVWVDSSLNQIGYYQNAGALNARNAGQFYAAPPVSGSNTTGAASYNAWGGNILVQNAGDFNGDGLLDVVAYDYTNAAAFGGVPDVVVGFNNGHANTSNQVNNFTFKTVLPAASGINLNVAFVEPVTIKAGANTSFLLATGNGLATMTADANGNFGQPTPLILGLDLNCPLNYADVGDIDGDGAVDIVVAYGGDASCGGHGSTPSGYFTFLGSGGGAFQPATFTQLGGALYMVKLINFTGAPGNLDLAASDLDVPDGFYSVYVIPNSADGSGTFDKDSLTENATGYIVSDIIPGDFNNDGKQDLTLTTEGQNVPLSFMPAPDTTGVLLLPSLGTQPFISFGTPMLVDSGFYALWGSYADFNGDGYPDLVVATAETTAGIDNPFGMPPAVPLVQIMPNQNGYLGPVLTQLDSARDVGTIYTFVGNFGNTGGNDLLVTSNFNTAEFLNQGAGTLTLTTSSNHPVAGVSVTLTATTSQATSGYAPTGSVTFSVNGTVLGASPLNGGTAAFTTTALPVGADTVTASYSGDEFHNASTARVSISVGPSAPMFTVATSANSLSLQQGATGSVTLNLSANGTFAGAISFACSGAPAATTCAVNPGSLTLGANQIGNVTVIVATTPKNDQYQAINRSWMSRTGAFSLAGVLLFMIPRRRRLYGRLAVVAFAIVSLGSIAMLSGCSDSGNKYPGTPPGTATITVTATSGAITQTQTIALTVTQ